MSAVALMSEPCGLDDDEVALDEGRAGNAVARHCRFELAEQVVLPAGAHPAKTVSPEVIRHLPPAVHEAYAKAVAQSLHPVFVVAAFISVFAFLLTWLLREVPLRGSSPLDGEEVTGAASAEAATVSRSPTD